MGWLFVRDPSDLDKTEQEELAVIRQASSIADIVYELVQDFTRWTVNRA
jgi:hypothetical protein